jgi:hypothetical protein
MTYGAGGTGHMGGHTPHVSHVPAHHHQQPPLNGAYPQPEGHHRISRRARAGRLRWQASIAILVIVFGMVIAFMLL